MKVTYEAHVGSDLSVVNMARVSFGKRSSALTAKDQRLIGYLANHKHFTPFAHPQVTLHVHAPIFVARQCFKHKVGFVENEVSRRYVDDAPAFHVPEAWRSSAADKKQGSGGRLSVQAETEAYAAAGRGMKAVAAAYHDLIALGVAPEQARMVLPQSMMTEWFWTGSLAAWARFYGLRSSPDAQAETAEIARQVGDIILPLFPVSWLALTCAS